MVVKKWFTLLTVTGLTGFVVSSSVAGCSTTDVVPADPTTTNDGGGVDTGTKKPPPPVGDQEEPTTKSECPIDPFVFSDKEVEAETKAPWQPAIQTKGACTDTELLRFGQNLEESDETTPIDDFGEGLSAACKGCLISKTTDPNWQFLVAIPGKDPSAGFLNWGACHAIEEGSNDCGKAYQYNQFCVNTACAKCETESEDDECIDTVWGAGGACDEINNSAETKCPNLAQSICGESAEEYAAVICGGATQDAGSDADAQ